MNKIYEKVHTNEQGISKFKWTNKVMESVEEWGALLAPPESRNGSWRRFLFLENNLPNNIVCVDVR